MTRYVFADPITGRQDEHRQLVRQLGDMLDPFTMRRLESTGLLHQPLRCLEIGAGAGTIAHQLADRLPDSGRVLATDLDTSNIAAHPRVTPLVHNIATDPLEQEFDLIHARLVLGHLPKREQIVGKLAAALVPGGALVIEEFHASWDRCVMHSPDPDGPGLFAEYHRALTTVLTQAGVDTGWGLRVHPTMAAHGLVDLDTELWGRSWYGGQAGCLLPFYASSQLESKLVTAGMSRKHLDRFGRLLMDPELVIYGNLTVSTIGFKAANDG